MNTLLSKARSIVTSLTYSHGVVAPLLETSGILEQPSLHGSMVAWSTNG
ncbi:hypothetical protein [Halioglobus japonicus]|nr:hypothetical protein [Halioglobus japonicus]